MLFSKNRHSNSLKALVYIAKQRPKKSAVYIGDAYLTVSELKSKVK